METEERNKKVTLYFRKAIILTDTLDKTRQYVCVSGVCVASGAGVMGDSCGD